jgi:hypothetical protein
MTDMKEMEKFTEVTVEDNVPDKDVFNSDAPYDSGWEFDTNANSHTVVFEHKLHAVPTRFMIFFSADKETVYPLMWPWGATYSGNPVTISANRKSIKLNIYSGARLHGVWSANEPWLFYQGGYWRVFAWR